MKKLVIGLACLGAVVAVETFGIDQYDKKSYDRSIAYVGQLIFNQRNELAQNKEQAARYKAQGIIVSELDGPNKSLEWAAKAYKRLDFCLRTQRFLLRPSDDAWIYCKSASGLNYL